MPEAEGRKMSALNDFEKKAQEAFDQICKHYCKKEAEWQLEKGYTREQLNDNYDDFIEEICGKCPLAQVL